MYQPPSNNQDNPENRKDPKNEDNPENEDNLKKGPSKMKMD